MSWSVAIRFLTGARDFYSVLQRPNRFWDPPSGYSGICPMGYSGWGREADHSALSSGETNYVGVISILNIGCLHPVACVRSTQLVIKDDHYNVSDIIKHRIRCQLTNPS
jgi:hypothetical protein